MRSPRRPPPGSNARGGPRCATPSHPADGDVVGELDAAIGATSVDIAKPAAWWRVVHVVQLLGAVAVVAGLVWLLAQAIMSFTSADLPDLGKVAGSAVGGGGGRRQH